MVRLSIAIQHHPARAELLGPLLASIDAQVEVVSDPDPHDRLRSPWRCYRHALGLTPSWATHRLILQDDVEVCRDFVTTALRAIRTHPGRLIAFYVGGWPPDHARAVYRACTADLSWCELDYQRLCHAVALCWPAQHVADMVEWADEQRWPLDWTADDEIIGRFLRYRKESAVATVPSLVEHPDVVESVKQRGKRHHGGRDSGRVAACMIHPDDDPLAIDWTSGALL